LNADLVQPFLILAEHFGDTADREDVSYRSHCQAARLARALGPSQFQGSNSSSL
jgi:hypothetical protein